MEPKQPCAKCVELQKRLDSYKATLELLQADLDESNEALESIALDLGLKPDALLENIVKASRSRVTLQHERNRKHKGIDLAKHLRASFEAMIELADWYSSRRKG